VRNAPGEKCIAKLRLFPSISAPTVYPYAEKRITFIRRRLAKTHWMAGI
jgi:hypothetical protein